jgi:glutathione S-transferase
LHPTDALERARHRAWIEFGSALLNTIGAFYTAPDETALAQRRDELVKRFGQLESELEARPGPFFAGDRFSIVDAIFGPVFRYFDVFDRFGDFGFFERTPRVLAWRRALAARPSVRDAVRADYAALLLDFIERRGSALARRCRSARIPAAARGDSIRVADVAEGSAAPVRCAPER